MTVKELSKLYHLNREIELNKRQLARLEDEIQSDAERLAELRLSMDGLASPNLDGLPRGTDVHSRVEDTAVQIVSLEESIRRKHDAEMNIQASILARQTLCVLERERLEKYIDGITDSLLRMIFTLRFVNGLPWEQVAAGISPNQKAESVRRACYRYLNEEKVKMRNEKAAKGESGNVSKWKMAFEAPSKSCHGLSHDKKKKE